MGIYLANAFAATLTTFALGLSTIYAILWYLQGFKTHPQEPKIAKSWLPYIGHPLGIVFQGSRYVKDLSFKHREPIFTLPVPGSRLYIVADPTIASHVQRASKMLTFTDLIPESTSRLFGLHSNFQKIVCENMDEPGGYLFEVMKLLKMLEEGDYLRELSLTTVQSFSEHLSNLQTGGNVSLQLWVQDLVGISSSKFILGPQNPIVDNPDLLNDFWAFDRGMGALLVGIAPSITARKAYNGRERVVKAIEEYYQKGGYKDVTKLLEIRYRFETEQFDLDSDSIARSAFGLLFASIVNTTTTTVWILLRLYADPGLLAQVRAEVAVAIKASAAEHGQNHLSVSRIVEDCPLLLAVFREILRMGSENFGVRFVKEDTVLNGQYFLKKGGVVQISGGAIHSDREIWGDDVNDFNPYRFLAKPTAAGKAPRGFKPAAFRGFGGGTTLCPGRHFATNEIVCLAAMVVRCFDMTAPNGKPVVVPPKNDMVLPIHVLEPVEGEWDKVSFSPRKEASELGRYVIVD